MSTESNKTLIRRFWEGVFNQKNLAVIDEICTPDMVYHAPTGPIQGREAFKQFIGMYLGAFPDFHITIEDIVAEEDKVAVRQATTATHQGELMGIPPSGKRISVSGIHVTRVVNGKAVEDWGNDDMLGMLQQLGVIPSMA
jgi:steroid delta-isomerase-like uncharacterized protein